MDSLLLTIIIAIIINIIELAIIQKLYPKTIELKVIDGIPTAIVYSKNFFLPLTTKVRRYQNIEKVGISTKTRRYRDGRRYEVYDLLIKYSNNKTKALFCDKVNEKEVLKYCEQINNFLKSLEYTVVHENKSKAGNFVVIAALLLVPPFLLIHPDTVDKVEYTTDEVYIFMSRICLIATSVLALCVALSLLMNYFTYISKKEKVIKSTSDNINISNYNKDYKKEKVKYNTNNEEEAQRIYDSIIK